MIAANLPSRARRGERALARPRGGRERGRRRAFPRWIEVRRQGIVAAIAQDVDTGAYPHAGERANRGGGVPAETVRRRFGKGVDRNCGAKERRGELYRSESVHVDCDRDSLIYLGVPTGPTCHAFAHTCYYKRVDGPDGAAVREGGGRHAAEEALTTLYELEATIEARRVEKVDEDAASPLGTLRLLIIRNSCVRRFARRRA